MKYIFLLCSFFFVIISCSEEETLYFATERFTDEKCKACPAIKIEIPEAMGPEKVAKTINTALREEIISILTDGESGQAEDIDGAIKAFSEYFFEVRDKYPDEAASWNADIRAQVSYQNAGLVSIVLEANMFTGGAHGYRVARYLNFDREKGTELDAEQLFRDLEGFTAYAEIRFRQQENIQASESINSTGFMFDSEQFYLPENIGLSEEGLILLYNEYEVASYADGRVMLTLTFEDIQEYLKPQFRSMDSTM